MVTYLNGAEVPESQKYLAIDIFRTHFVHIEDGVTQQNYMMEMVRFGLQLPSFFATLKYIILEFSASPDLPQYLFVPAVLV